MKILTFSLIAATLSAQIAFAQFGNVKPEPVQKPNNMTLIADCEGAKLELNRDNLKYNLSFNYAGELKIATECTGIRDAGGIPAAPNRVQCSVDGLTVVYTMNDSGFAGTIKKMRLGSETINCK